MKRKLIVLLTAVLSISMLFVSCSNETKIDERVSASFGVSPGRSLSSSASFADFDGLDWWYKARTSSNDFNYGQKTEWTKLKNGLATTLELSQGIWDFDLCAVVSGTTEIVEGAPTGNTHKVYYGSRAGVLVEKTNNGKPVSVLISVTPGSNGTGTIVISKDIIVNKRTGENSTIVANNYEIKDKDSGTVVYTGEIDNINVSKKVNAGSYLVTVYYKETNSGVTGGYILRATESIDVTVYDSSTITVVGSIDETTQAVIINPNNNYKVNEYKVESSITAVKTDGSFSDVTIVVPMTPLMSSSASENTIVTVPASIINANAGESDSPTVKVVVDVTPAIEASVNDAFNISSTIHSAAAAIDLTLFIGDTKVENYNTGDSLTVKTYVAKNLKDVKVSFNGTELSDYEYNTSTGYLRFTTTHFSTFVVETTSKAIIYDTAYDSLPDAVASAQNGDVITLIANSEMDDSLIINGGKQLTINLNSFDISAPEKVIQIKHANVTLTGNGTIYETQNDGYGAVILFGSGTDQGANYSVVNVDENVSLRGWSGIFVSSDESDTYNNYGVVANVKGKIILPGMDIHTTKNGAGIYINGQNNNIVGNVPEFNLDGAEITGDTGIYSAGYAKWNLNNVKIDAESEALSIKAGKFVIDGGNYKARGEFHDPNLDSSNGSVETGAALSMTSNDSYAHKIDVTVINGTFESQNGYAVYEGIPYDENNPSELVSSESYVTLDIRGGNFIGANYKDAIKLNDIKVPLVITGGTYSTDPSDYVTLGYNAELDSEKYVVSSTSDIIIKSANQLMKFAASVNTGTDYAGETIALGNDIDLAGKTWVPIGYSSRSSDTSGYVFSGTFNGQNHTITNIKYDETKDKMPSGFFGSVEGATISNLIIGGTKQNDGSYVYDGVSSFNGDKDSAAGVVSFVIGTGDTVISNCKNYATISGAAPAGIVSRLYNTTSVSNKIINCYNFGVIDGKNSTSSGKAGGIVAITKSGSSSEISNCHNYGIVETYDFNAGGIIGYINPGCTITGCTNNATVSNNDAISPISLISAGGIVGWVADTSPKTISVSDCKNVGQILSDVCAGGIAGRISNQTTIDNCTNDGVVSNYENKGYAGGIVGNNDGGIVKNCINTATVSGVQYSGGVVGYWGFTSNVSGSINNCSGGTEDITIINGTNKWAGRIIGCANCVHTSPGSISIDDSNTDKYENGLKTIGLSTPGTLKDVLIIESGTMHGLPGLREDPNQSVHTIIFKQNTKLIEDDITYNFTTRDVEINTMVDSGKLVWNTSSLSEFRVNS